MTIELPDFALVILMGASGCGKSTFARTHFAETEVLSSDRFRGWVSDDETRQDATGDAFDALHHILGLRLKRRRLTVIDATNVQEGARRPLMALARRYHAVPVAIVLDAPESVCHARNRERPDRAFGPHVVRRHVKELRQSLRGLKREGWRYVFHLDGIDAIENATIDRVPLWTDRRTECGPFDIIGDVHGCYDELTALLETLGYAPGEDGGAWRHPEGRRLVFVGDLVDRGPRSVEVASLVMDCVDAGTALCVPGNHDDKLKRAIDGKNVTVNHGLAESLEQIEALPEEARGAFRTRWSAFVEGLVSHLWLDGGALAVAHAGVTEELLGRASGRVREFCLYGDTTGESDERGLPVRRDWAADYTGETLVVYGHTPVDAAIFRGNTINLDTGCVFGGALTALRWPERTLAAAPAARAWAEAPTRLTDAAPAPDDTRLDLADFLGRRTIPTALAGNVVVAEGNAAAALEIISRFAVPPGWLIYLPPTMSPVETSARDGWLERPEEAFAYFRRQGIKEVVCQEKHMGSRAVLTLCRDPETAARRFGARDGECGVVTTRTGRPFFDDPKWTQALLSETIDALEASGIWNALSTDWVCMDAEILPWNAKAKGLLREQYAPTAAAGLAALGASRQSAEAARARGVAEAEPLAQRLRTREANVEAYREAYRRYCWQVSSLEDMTVAPFHLLAGEGRTFVDRDHTWHRETLARLAKVSPRFRATGHQEVDLEDADQIEAAAAWWESKTNEGAEGMVIKPREYIPPGGCQPAVKVRGREYLRIIYGPEYTDPDQLPRLKERSLHTKRRLAVREFALGIEGLERFVRREPLRRIHECSFAVLALESEPVDPRL